jgi:hypothetical protein
MRVAFGSRHGGPAPRQPPIIGEVGDAWNSEVRTGAGVNAPGIGTDRSRGWRCERSAGLGMLTCNAREPCQQEDGPGVCGQAVMRDLGPKQCCPGHHLVGGAPNVSAVVVEK